MARALERLTALQIGRLKLPGMYADGGGLYLQIASAGARSWIFRYRIGGRKTAREMGLGSAATIGLAAARDAAGDARRLLTAGIDPLEDRAAKRTAEALAAAKSTTFQECAAAYIESHSAGWKNEKHADQWTATLKTYAYPEFGALPVGSVDVGLVLKVLEPIWTTKTETASRVRGRIECVLDWAKVRGYRSGENPARWRGNLDHLLPKRSKVQKVKHHAALPFTEIGAFMRDLRARSGVAARALEFVILTAARTSEATGTTYAEIIRDASLWTVPAERIKAGRIHRVPLSSAALAVVARQVAEFGEAPDQLVFPGDRQGKPLCENALLAVLERMGRSDLTVHGFRSSFRDWAAEYTNYPREVAEQALAHSIGDKVEAAYRRGDLFNKRQRLMEDWANYCATVQPAGVVIPMHRSA